MVSIDEKDADYIANICREEIKSSTDARDRVVEETKEKFEKAKSLFVLLDLKGHKKAEKDLKELEESVSEAIAKVNKRCDEEIGKWTKIIELVTVGSN